MTLDHILHRICEARDVKVEDVLGKSREQRIKDTRHIFVEIATRYGHSKQIMNYLGRNRTTQYNSRNVASWQLQSEVERCYQHLSMAALLAHIEKRKAQRAGTYQREKNQIKLAQEINKS
jgi:hypothetical protein